MIDEVVHYLEAGEPKGGALDAREALDRVVYAKVLPKLRGDDSPRYEEALGACGKVLRERGLERSAANRGFQELREAVLVGPPHVDCRLLIDDEEILPIDAVGNVASTSPGPGGPAAASRRAWTWKPGFYAGTVRAELVDDTGRALGQLGAVGAEANPHVLFERLRRRETDLHCAVAAVQREPASVLRPRRQLVAFHQARRAERELHLWLQKSAANTKGERCADLWSVSRRCQPDLVLRWRREGRSGFVVLDAKYRASRGAILDGMAESAHLYRDALRWGATSPEASLLLVPDAGAVSWLAEEAYVASHGVGVVTLRPGTEPPGWLRGLLLGERASVS